MAENDDLINRDLIHRWLAWGLAWLLVFPTVGALVSTKFNEPEFLGGVAWLSFGRLRPIHVNGVIWGTFSTLFVGLCYYIVPRLAGVRLWRERWGDALLWVWNLNLLAAVVLLGLGWNRGWEAGELPLPNVLVLFLCLVALTAQCLMTIRNRREPPLYVSLWYLIAALVWTDVNLVLLMLGPTHIPGINNAAWHGLFIHNVVGLWITPAGYVLIYYFLPASVRNPIYSHKLSLIGFWTLAFFYPFVGIHHYLYSPIADWAETIAIVSSMLLIAPVWTVLQNFFGTMVGRWHEFGRNLPAKLLIVGAVLYLLGCTQGALQALRSLQQPTHFTDFVIAHSHLTVFGTFVVWTLAGTLYVWPRVTGSELWSPRLGTWSFWLITMGISSMVLVLAAQGLRQGLMLMAGAAWLDTVDAMRPYWWVRTFTGIAMDVGIALLVVNLVGGPRRSSAAAPVTGPVRRAPAPARRLQLASIRSLALGAGFGFVTLALFVQGALPALIPASRTTRVTRAVRTDLGDVKWVRYGASNYTPLERLGRSVYIREGCWYCHSQYVRPVAGEELRWGPVSEAGEYAYDLPHLLSTRRIGPDLSRVGLKYSDDWHYAHQWDPRLVVPESIMPSVPWLFTELRVPVRDGGNGRTLEPTAELKRYFTMRGDRRIVLFPSESGVTFVPPRPDGELPIEGTPVLDVTPLAHAGRPGEPAVATPPRQAAVRLVIPSKELVALVRYLQKLGTNRGAWRDVFEPQRVPVSAVTVPDSAELSAQGKAAYAEHCVGCHGARGDGNGPAATFLSPRPRDFTLGVFKFRSTPSGALPTDGDLFQTITRGVRWTAMPPWHELPEQERRALVVYIKTFATRWREGAAEPPLARPSPPRATPALLARGNALYETAKCAECHGETGRGDGPSAGELKDDADLPIRPTDFTRGQFKGGAQATDIYRAMTLGLDGTPMPSFADSMTDDERWAISYYVLSLSAWIDPATGERLNLGAETKAALDSHTIRADRPADAWDPDRPRAGVAAARGAPRRVFGGIGE